MVADILCEFLEVAIHLILYVREVYPSGIFQKRKKYNVPVQVCVLLPRSGGEQCLMSNVCVLVCPQMSCHPELNQYIQDTLHCMKPLIEKVGSYPTLLVFGGRVCHRCHSHIYVLFPEWCREGGRGHHGQRASPGREIRVWDFPTYTAVNKVRIGWFHVIPRSVYVIPLWKAFLIRLCLCCCSSDTLLSHVEQLLRAFILKISVCDAVLNNNPPGKGTVNTWTEFL